MDSSGKSSPSAIELNHLVERLSNLIYLLKCEPEGSQRIPIYLQFADAAVEQIKMLIRQSDFDIHDFTA